MKTLLVALLLLVVGTGTAFAECAWVLWLKELSVPVTLEKPKEEKPKAVWRPQMGFPDALLCIESLRNLLDKRRGDPEYAVAEFTVIYTPNPISGVPGFASITTYSCLPDTVDPREPKGGGR